MTTEIEKLSTDTSNINATALHHGMLYAMLQDVKQNVVMGEIKEAGHKIHEALKFMEEKFIAAYYKVKDETESEQLTPLAKTEICAPDHIEL